MRRVVESRNLVNVVVSTAVGLYLFRNWPFPAEKRSAANGAASEAVSVLRNQVWLYCHAVFDTVHRVLDPILISIHFCYTARRTNWSQGFAPYLSPERRHDLYLVVRELHHPKRPQPETGSPVAHCAGAWPFYRDRDLWAVGSGKTTGCT